MALTKEQIETLFGRFHRMPPPHLPRKIRYPHDVYILQNERIYASSLHESCPMDGSVCEMAHELGRQDRLKYHIFGVTPFAGADRMWLSSDAPERTATHELLHVNGVSSEAEAHALAPMLIKKLPHRPWRSPRQVKYRQVPVSESEKESLLRSMKLRGETPRDIQETRLVHLVLVEGGRERQDLVYDPSIRVPITVKIPRYDLVYDPSFA